MKQTLLSIKALATFVFLLQFTFASSQMIRLPNMDTQKRKLGIPSQSIPDNTIQLRNYQLNFAEKTYYNIKFGEFISDRNISIQEGKNELTILTNSEGKCYAIADYISAEKKAHPENKHLELMAKKLHPKGTWTLGRISGYLGIFCIENDLNLFIYKTASYLVIEFKDKSLQSESIVDEFVKFQSLEEFIAYQNKMGNTPDERQVFAAEQRKKAKEEKERTIALDSLLEIERASLSVSIDSIDKIFSGIEKSVLKSTNPQYIEQYLDSIPNKELYQSLKEKVDEYNKKALNLNETNKLKLYADTISAVNCDYYRDLAEWTKNLISTRKEKVISNKLAQEKRQREKQIREKELLVKYGNAYKRYKNEGFYTGMSFDLTLAITTVLIPNGIAGGVKYYNGPFKQKFGFKENKLVYFSGN